MMVSNAASKNANAAGFDATRQNGDAPDDERRRGLHAYLLHDAGFALGESNVATRLILDELYFDLSAFTARLVVIVVVVVDVLVRTGALDATVRIAGSERAVASASAGIVVPGRGIGIVVGDFGRHDGDVWVTGRIGNCV